MKKQTNNNNNKKPKTKNPISVRLDPDQISEAHKLGINISAVAREAVAKEIYKHKPTKCPTCGKHP